MTERMIRSTYGLRTADKLRPSEFRPVAGAGARVWGPLIGAIMWALIALGIMLYGGWLDFGPL